MCPPDSTATAMARCSFIMHVSELRQFGVDEMELCHGPHVLIVATAPVDLVDAMQCQGPFTMSGTVHNVKDR